MNSIENMSYNCPQFLTLFSRFDKITLGSSNAKLSWHKSMIFMLFVLNSFVKIC